jgi:hypothetical protein
VITGWIYGTSNNAYAETYVAIKPRYGAITVDPTSGRFTYTPNPNLIRPGYTDTFTVTVSNGTTAQMPGALGMMQTLLHSLAIRLGISEPDAVTQTVTIKVSGDGQYGDLGNSKFATKQSYDNCTLMATASAIYQITGTQPSEADMVNFARITNSVAHPGQKMYLDVNIATGVAVQDAVVLMKKYFNLTARTTQYGQDGQTALSDLEAALANGNAAMTTLAIDGVWASIPDSSPTPDPSYTNANHEVTVIKVDTQGGWVYVNDSSATDKNYQPMGAGMKVAMGTFLSAWQASKYELTIVDKLPSSA